MATVFRAYKMIALAVIVVAFAPSVAVSQQPGPFFDPRRLPDLDAERREREAQQDQRSATEADSKRKAEEQRAEAEAKRKADEQRLATEAEAKRKSEEQRLAAEAEAKRKADEQRLAAEAEAKRKAEEQRLASETEAKRKAEEQRLAAEAEAKRKAEEQRLAAEAEAKRKAEEQRLAAEAEAKRKSEEQRLATEAEAKRKAEEQRLAAEAESKRKAEEQRLAAEAEAKRKAEEQRLAAEAEAKRKTEEQRLAAETEAKRKAEEQRLAAEAEAKRRTAALATDPSTSAAPAPTAASAATCAETPKISSKPLPAGRLELSIDSPCRRGQRVAIAYGDHKRSFALDPKNGRATVVLDLYLGAGQDFVVTTADEKQVSVAAGTPSDANSYSKIALIWTKPVDLDLHAFEAGTTGAVNAKTARTADEAKSLLEASGRGAGFMSTLDDGSAGSGSHVEVYTFLHAPDQPSGAIAFALDHASRGAVAGGEACGQGALAEVDFEVVRLVRGASLERDNGIISAVACGTPLDGRARFMREAIPDLKFRR